MYPLNSEGLKRRGAPVLYHTLAPADPEQRVFRQEFGETGPAGNGGEQLKQILVPIQIQVNAGPVNEYRADSQRAPPEQIPNRPGKAQPGYRKHLPGTGSVLQHPQVTYIESAENGGAYGGIAYPPANPGLKPADKIIPNTPYFPLDCPLYRPESQRGQADETGENEYLGT
jgi:hypothetical protein